MEILLCSLYTLLFLLLIRRMRFFQLEGLGRWTPSLFFLLKIGAGVTLWALYTFYYTDTQNADIYKYYNDGMIMHDALHTAPGDYFRMLFGIGNNTPHFDLYYQKMDHWYREFDSNLYNDSHTIIRFNAFVRLFSFGYFNVHTVFMCFLSFTGLCALYKTFYPALQQWKKALAVSVFLFPSVLFWGSGVLKEGLLFFGLGLLLYHFFGWLNDRRWLHLPWIAGCLALLLVTKFYIVVSVAPALIGAAWIGLSGKTRFAALKYGLVLVLYVTAGLFTDKLFPGYNPLQVLSIKQRDFLNLARGGTYMYNDTAVVFIAPDKHAYVKKDPGGKTAQIATGCSYYYWRVENLDDTLFVTDAHSDARYTIMTDFSPAGSLMNVNRLDPTVSSFVKNTPVSTWNTFARPYPWEARSPLLAMPALENLFICCCILLCLLAFSARSPHAHLAAFCLVFVLLLFAITGLTTPVMGALVRYKIPGIPFLLIALLLLSDREKLEKRVPWIGKFL